ncbi:MAG TPA: rhodanese-like domain-containing protein [Deinococcales bacterium]|nr:rhodanese-like domain-containing protein [Deinococcales bacterium]
MPTPTYANIAPADLSAWQARGARIIDVREAWEYARGHIPGAEALPMGDVPDRAGSLTGPLVLVCATGARSATVAAYLTAHGTQDVASLSGGTVAWVRARRPLER